jgi:molybdopterin-guanine dinucleotide biosynthesis protein A
MVAAAILAGGGAQRLGGIVKPLLLVDGMRIVDRQLSVLRPLFDAIAIVTFDGTAYADVAVDVISDRTGPGFGPLAGVDAALAWLPSQFDAVLCVAGDMPFLSTPVLRRLRDAPAALAVVPRTARGPEPLCARYDRRLSALIATELSTGTRAMHRFLARLDVVAPDEPPTRVAWINEAELRTLDPDLRTFVNVNTPDDLFLR